MSDLRVDFQTMKELLLPLVSTEDGQVIACDELVTSDLFSRVAMSLITEPGDRFAGALLEYLGATKFLSLLINQQPVEGLRQALNESGANSTFAIEDAFASGLQELWVAGLERYLPRLSLSGVKGSLATFSNLGGTLVWPNSRFFPRELDVLRWARPHLLWVRGNAEVLAFDNSCAIVGSRTATNYGTQLAAELATFAGEKNITTVSGGAFGIDALVHLASLRNSAPTIAVMAGGLDQFYPRSNEPLFTELLESNVIVAEVAPGVTPAKWRFLQRNRIIAALGQATVVVEAGHRSGSINTAKTALELQRPVGVVPGSVFWSTSVGCHRLLKEHPGEVQVVCNGRDLVHLVCPSGFELESIQSLGVLETRALDAFNGRPLALGDVQRIAGLTFAETQLALGKLELSGHIVRHSLGYQKAGHTL